MTHAEFEFEMDDWMAFQKHHISSSAQYKRSKIFVSLIFPIVAIITLIARRNDTRFLIYGSIVYGILTILWLLMYPKRFDKKSLNRIKKTLEEGNNSTFLGLHKIEFNQEYILYTSKYSEQKLSWKAIVKISENDEYIFIYNSAVTAIIIPKIKVHSDFLHELRLVINNKAHL